MAPGLLRCARNDGWDRLPHMIRAFAEPLVFFTIPFLLYALVLLIRLINRWRSTIGRAGW